jgi:hypothetical protein
MDVINSVGLGETLLKLIERRQRVDIWLVHGGMVGEQRCPRLFICAQQLMRPLPSRPCIAQLSLSLR